MLIIYTLREKKKHMNYPHLLRGNIFLACYSKRLNWCRERNQNSINRHILIVNFCYLEAFLFWSLSRQMLWWLLDLQVLKSQCLILNLIVLTVIVLTGTWVFWQVIIIIFFRIIFFKVLFFLHLSKWEKNVGRRKNKCWRIILTKTVLSHLQKLFFHLFHKRKKKKKAEKKSSWQGFFLFHLAKSFFLLFFADETKKS